LSNRRVLVMLYAVAYIWHGTLTRTIWIARK